MNLKFTFALNADGQFQSSHFGDAYHFAIYQFNNNSLLPIKTLENPFRDSDENYGHGHKSKGEAIVKLLKDENVNVLVSMQFGKNIKVINQFFIPVLISNEQLDAVIISLQNNYKLIEEAWALSSSEYKIIKL